MYSYTNNDTDENNQQVEKLNEKLKTKEKELCEIRIRLGECKEEYNGLNETNRTLKTDMKSLNTKLADAKLSAARTEEKLTQERDSLRNDLETKCRQLSDLKARYDEERRDAEDRKCKYNRLFMTLTEVNKASGQNHYEMKTRINELQNEICAKKEELCKLKTRVKDLERENDFNAMEINAQKNKIFEKECHLKRLVLLSDKIMKVTKQSCDACCGPEKEIEKLLATITCPELKCGSNEDTDPYGCQLSLCSKPTTEKCAKNLADDDCNILNPEELKQLFCL